MTLRCHTAEAKFDTGPLTVYQWPSILLMCRVDVVDLGFGTCGVVECVGGTKCNMNRGLPPHGGVGMDFHWNTSDVTGPTAVTRDFSWVHGKK